jgi:hypothetical protein
MLLVAQRIGGQEPCSRQVQRIAQVARARAHDLSVTIDQAKLEPDARGVDVEHHADIAGLRATPRLELAGHVDVGEGDL